MYLHIILKRREIPLQGRTPRFSFALPTTLVIFNVFSTKASPDLGMLIRRRPNVGI